MYTYLLTSADGNDLIASITKPHLQAIRDRASEFKWEYSKKHSLDGTFEMIIEHECTTSEELEEFILTCPDKNIYCCGQTVHKAIGDRYVTNYV